MAKEKKRGGCTSTSKRKEEEELLNKRKEKGQRSPEPLGPSVATRIFRKRRDEKE